MISMEVIAVLNFEIGIKKQNCVSCSKNVPYVIKIESIQYHQFVITN